MRAMLMLRALLTALLLAALASPIIVALLANTGGR